MYTIDLFTFLLLKNSFGSSIFYSIDLPGMSLFCVIIKVTHFLCFGAFFSRCFGCELLARATLKSMTPMTYDVYNTRFRSRSKAELASVHNQHSTKALE